MDGVFPTFLPYLVILPFILKRQSDSWYLFLKDSCLKKLIKLASLVNQHALFSYGGWNYEWVCRR